MVIFIIDNAKVNSLHYKVYKPMLTHFCQIMKMKDGTTSSILKQVKTHACVIYIYLHTCLDGFFGQ